MKTLQRYLFCLCVLLIASAAGATFAEDTHELTVSTIDEQHAQTQAPQQPKISLNKATVRELIKLKGVKPNNAKALVRYRKKHGDFKSVDEISYVKGFKRMKPQTLKQIEAQLTL